MPFARCKLKIERGLQLLTAAWRGTRLNEVANRGFHEPLRKAITSVRTEKIYMLQQIPCLKSWSRWKSCTISTVSSHHLLMWNVCQLYFFVFLNSFLCRRLVVSQLRGAIIGIQIASRQTFKGIIRILMIINFRFDWDFTSCLPETQFCWCSSALISPCTSAASTDLN